MTVKKRARGTRGKPRGDDARSLELRALGYLTPPEAAALVGVAVTTVYGWAWRQGKGAGSGPLPEVDPALPAVARGAIRSGETQQGSVWILRASLAKKFGLPEAKAGA
jgi:hypothetical protein